MGVERVTDKVVVMSTAASIEEAEKIADHLMEERLAACVTILPGVRSVYRWKGAVEKADEIMMLIKTRRELVARLTEVLLKAHSYETPEVVALPIVDGSSAYLEWLDHQLPADS
jgi:periplasmic divalent cation tolerance protein